MPIAPELMDPFHKRLYVQLQERIEDYKEHLALGSATALPENKITTAELYAAKVSYISALKYVLEVCEAVDREMHGVKSVEG